MAVKKKAPSKRGKSEREIKKKRSVRAPKKKRGAERAGAAQKRKTTGRTLGKKPSAKSEIIIVPEKRKKVPKGRTLKTKDEYLPVDKRGKSEDPKIERWVAVIDVNDDAELAVVRMTTRKQKNTFPLDTYRRGNKRKTRIKTFVETEDREGNPIAVDGVRFIENPHTEDLSRSEVDFITEQVTIHAKQSSENRKKLKKLHEKKQD